MRVVAPLYVALVHHPVLARNGDILTTAVTNLDVHDIARSSRTFGVRGYFVVTPIEAQRRIVDRILEHWNDGEGRERLPERGQALARVSAVPLLPDAIAAITSAHGEPPRIVATSAQAGPDDARVTFDALRADLRATERPHLLVFGTGHGLAPSILASSDVVLEPIRGVDGYNHLSVRGAVAIILDRLNS